MERTELANKVRNIIAEHLGVSKSQIEDDSDIIEDLGADSLDTVEIVMSIEEECGITIDDSDIESGKVKTFKQVVDYIHQQMSE